MTFMVVATTEYFTVLRKDNKNMHTIESNFEMHAKLLDTDTGTIPNALVEYSERQEKEKVPLFKGKSGEKSEHVKSNSYYFLSG